MSITETTRRAGPYATDGSQVEFPFAFKVFKAEDVVVTRSENGLDTDLTLTTDYTVNLNPNQDAAPGGEVVLTSAPNGPTITITSGMAATQPTVFTNAGGFFPRVLNDSLDRVTILIQQLMERVSRVPLLPLGDAPVGQFPVVLPNGKFGWSTGSGTDSGLRADLGTDAPGKGDDIVVHADDYAETTVRNRINILSATARPAMVGIFSSGTDQRAALIDFISKSAADGKTIEWGPIDVSLDAVTNIGSVRGLGVPSGSRWVMHPNTVIRALPNDSPSYTLINCWNVEDVIIEGCGAKLIGERDDHTGVAGEHGHGVRIQGSNNVIIRDLHAEDMWGDGFYIGSTPEQAFVQNVLLENVSADNCRRQGLSLISAKDFRCVRGRFTNTNGTLPEYGIDLEPNSPGEFLEDIEFLDCFTGGNNSYGIGIFLNAMEGSTNPVGVRIINHVDDGSNSAFAANRAVDIPGLIEYIDGKSINAVGPGIVSRGKGATGPRYKIVRPTVVDWNRAGGGSTTFGSAILLYAANGDSGTYALGGIDIIEPDIQLTSGSGTNAIACLDQRTTTPDPMKDIQIDRPLNLAGLLSIVGGVKRFHDPLRKSVRTMADASTNVQLSSFGAHVEIPALTSSRNFDISNTQEIGLEMTFELIGAGTGQARIRFPAGVALFPDTITDGTGYIYSNTKGSRLKIRKVSASEWHVIEKVGTWATV